MCVCVCVVVCAVWVWCVCAESVSGELCLRLLIVDLCCLIYICVGNSFIIGRKIKGVWVQADEVLYVGWNRKTLPHYQNMSVESSVNLYILH